jgi:serine/threonine protein phosphatase PrpC
VSGIIARNSRKWRLRVKNFVFGEPVIPTEFESASKSITGGRKQNEDRCYSNDQRRFYLVADGIGGYKGGGLASQIAVESIPDMMHDTDIGPGLSDGQRVHVFRSAVHAACFEMSKVADEHDGYERMGCTLATAFVVDGELFYANVGDCRVYLCRDNCLIQLTSDETMVQNLVDARLITESQARSHRLRHIVTNSVSAHGLQKSPQLHKTQIGPDDTVLLTSDGLVNELSDDDICTVLRGAETSQACVDTLLDIAAQRDARDNVTCIVFRPTEKRISSVSNVGGRDQATHPTPF